MLEKPSWHHNSTIVFLLSGIAISLTFTQLECFWFPSENVIYVVFFCRIRWDAVQRISSNLERPGFARRRSLTTRRRESAGNATPLCRAPRELKSVKNVFRMNRNKKRNNKNIVEESWYFHLLSKVKEQFKPTETMEAYCLPRQTGHFDQSFSLFIFLDIQNKRSHTTLEWFQRPDIWSTNWWGDKEDNRRNGIWEKIV